MIMKNAQRTRKHCALAVARRSQKFSLRRRPPSRWRRTAKILSAGDGHYLYPQTAFLVNFYNFEEGKRRQLCIDLDAVSPTVRGLDVIYQSLNISWLYWLVAPQDSQICGGNFPKRKKIRPQSCAKYVV